MTEPRFCIYTAIIGDYDRLINPTVLHPQFDYVLFTDRYRWKCNPFSLQGQWPSSTPWQICRIQKEGRGNTLAARYIKAHPHVLFPEATSNYGATVFIDANIGITSGYIYERVIELFRSDILVSSMNHPFRDCIYDEGIAVIEGHRELPFKVNRLLDHLRAEGYPSHNGLVETNLLYRRCGIETESFNRLWWHYISHYSHRDQLSFNYVLWKYPIKYQHFLPEGYSTRNTPHLSYNPHQKRR